MEISSTFPFLLLRASWSLQRENTTPMSFLFQWHRMDDKIAQRTTTFLNEYFCNCTLPDFLADGIQVTHFDFGAQEPELEIVNIQNPFGIFYDPHEGYQEMVHEEFSDIASRPEGYEEQPQGYEKGYEKQPEGYDRQPEGYEQPEAYKQPEVYEQRQGKLFGDPHTFSPLHSSPLGSPDFQVLMRFQYDGDLRFQLKTELFLHLPTPSFLSLPISLNVKHIRLRGIVIEGYLTEGYPPMIFTGTLCVAYTRNRVHFCLLRQPECPEEYFHGRGLSSLILIVPCLILKSNRKSETRASQFSKTSPRLKSSSLISYEN